MWKAFVADKVYELRSAKGISARKLSLELGRSNSYINKIENRRTLPSLDELFEICDYFELNPSQFFNNGKESSALMCELIKLLLSLPESKQKATLEFLKKMNN